MAVLLGCRLADRQVLISALLLSVCIITVSVTCAAVAPISTDTVAVTRIVTTGVTFIGDKKITFTVTIEQRVNVRICQTLCPAIMETVTRVRKILLFIPT
jgi:hypothetical protein